MRARGGLALIADSNLQVSSPNTPGLRGLQHVDKLTNILTGVVAAAKSANRKQNPAIMVKVSPDEDADSQVAGICEAIKKSGCAGVVVGNTTLRKPDPLPAGYMLSEGEAALMLEQGGYSGPQLFERTVALVKRYRTILDEDDTAASPAPPSSLEQPPSSQPSNPKVGSEGLVTEVASQIQATTERDIAHLKPANPSQDASSKSQPLLRLPERNSPSSPSPSSSLSHPATPPDRPPALSSSSHINQLPSSHPSSSPEHTPSSSSAPADTALGPTAITASTSAKPRTVIFASGGITNGRQALEVLEAGASVAMVYTALVYGGVGTISRVKGELREEMKRRGK